MRRTGSELKEVLDSPRFHRDGQPVHEQRQEEEVLTLQVHLLSFRKHLLAAGTAGARGVVVLLSSLGGATELQRVLLPLEDSQDTA